MASGRTVPYAYGRCWVDASLAGGQGSRTGSSSPRVESVDLVQRPRKPAPEEVLMRWAKEWAKRAWL